ncbi:MAG: hypothetical protein CL775_06400, partial [Chloroflexi bacterium]|nr:hypothetical protein [Chloroflexota bacterium]
MQILLAKEFLLRKFQARDKDKEIDMQKISKTKALKMITTQSKGQFMTIANIKKNGDKRIYKSSKFNEILHSNINLWTADGYRSILPNTIFYLKGFGGQEYKVT